MSPSRRPGNARAYMDRMMGPRNGTRAGARGKGAGCQAAHRGGEPPRAKARRREPGGGEPPRAVAAKHRVLPRRDRTAKARDAKPRERGDGNGAREAKPHGRCAREVGRPRGDAARWGHRTLPPSRGRGGTAMGHGAHGRGDSS